MTQRFPEGHRVSMLDVARIAGVSHQTVSRVINNSPNVSPATRERITAIIKELNYRPSNSARALVTQHSRTIGMIAGGVNYFGPISTIASIEAVARNHGLFLSVAIVNEREYTQKVFEEVAGGFLDQGVDGFIFVAPTDAMLEAALTARFPQPRIILTSEHGGVDLEAELARQERESGTGPIKCLGVDQRAGVGSIVDHLKSLGHRDCLYLAGPMEWRDGASRQAAWRELSAGAGMRSDVVQLRTWDAGEAYQQVRQLFGEGGMYGKGAITRPTAVVAANDLQAVGVRRALGELGIDVPGEMSLVGFDDMAGSDNLMPPLTTVRPDFNVLGAKAMREMLYLMGSLDHEPSMAGVRHGVGVIPPTLVPRDSSGPARRAV